MAKIGFTKLGLKPNNEVVNIEFNEQIIEVKQYLPIEEKLAIIDRVLDKSRDQNNFANTIKIQVYLAIEIIEAYTNINFTDKQKENITKLYDLVSGNKLIDMIVEAIPQEEYDQLIDNTYGIIDGFYKYQNSVFGILSTVSQDYSNLSLDASSIYDKLNDPESLELLKSVMTKLG